MRLSVIELNSDKLAETQADIARSICRGCERTVSRVLLHHLRRTNSVKQTYPDDDAIQYIQIKRHQQDKPSFNYYHAIKLAEIEMFQIIIIRRANFYTSTSKADFNFNSDSI